MELTQSLVSGWHCAGLGTTFSGLFIMRDSELQISSVLAARLVQPNRPSVFTTPANKSFPATGGKQDVGHKPIVPFNMAGSRKPWGVEAGAGLDSLPGYGSLGKLT